MNKTVEPHDKITRLKLSDQVFEKLRDMLVSGELQPGDTVPSERTLMERFGVGRPAVREALQTMQSRGLVTIAHGERTRVNAPTAGLALNQIDDVARLLLSRDQSNIQHLKQVRCILERGTVRAAAEKCKPEDALELEHLVELQRQGIHDTCAFVKFDIAFHTRLSLISANPVIIAMTEMMLKLVLEFHASLLHWRGHEEATLSEHTQIVEHLRNQDADSAAKAMEEHLNRQERS